MVLTVSDILPILMTAVESPTPALVDVAMRGLPAILPILDFSTIKNELFPVIATVFSRTNSLAIKVRGLQAFAILCGGSSHPENQGDGLDGWSPSEGRISEAKQSRSDPGGLNEQGNGFLALHKHPHFASFAQAAQDHGLIHHHTKPARPNGRPGYRGFGKKRRSWLFSSLVSG